MAGESAQREFERRRARRRARLRTPAAHALAFAAIALSFVLGAVAPLLPTLMLGTGEVSLGMPSLLIGSVLAVGTAIRILAPPQSETAWRRGAEGERIVARALDGLTSNGARVLHDRRMPGSRANIDHLVMTSSGVFTVDAKRYAGKLEARRRGRELWVAGRNRTKLLDQARKQAATVAAVLGQEGLGTVPVQPALCFVGTEMPWLFAPRTIGDVLITTPGNVRDRLVGREHLSSGQMAAVARVLERQFPPAATAPPSSSSARPRTRNRPADAAPTSTSSIAPSAPVCRCGAPMVRRTRRSDGGGFYGCSTFPKCRRTRSLGDQD